MRLAFRIILWILSVSIALLSLVFFFAGALPGLLMLAAAAFTNPLIIQRLKWKNRVIVLLAVGLFFASIVTLTDAVHGDTAQVADREEQNVRSLQNDEEHASKAETNETESAFTTLASAETILPQITNYPKRSLKDVADSVRAKVIEHENTVSANDTSIVTSNPTPTQRPKVTPTVKPTPTQTPKATPTSTQTKSNVRAISTGIEIIDYTSVIGRGEYASIKIKGEPQTDYECEVEYQSGMSTAKGLGEKRSDSNGYVTWSWKVGTRTSTKYQPTIYIRGGGDSISVTFRVTE